MYSMMLVSSMCFDSHPNWILQFVHPLTHSHTHTINIFKHPWRYVCAVYAHSLCWALEPPQKFHHQLTFAHSLNRFNGHFNCPKCKCDRCEHQFWWYTVAATISMHGVRWYRPVLLFPFPFLFPCSSSIWSEFIKSMGLKQFFSVLCSHRQSI